MESSMDEEIHITVGRCFRRERKNILWVARQFPLARIILIHVHWPSKWMQCLGARVLDTWADELEKKAHILREKEDMIALLHKYTTICSKRKVEACFIEMEDVLTGIMSVVKKRNIKTLVTGSRFMAEQGELLECCQVLLLFRGQIISTSKVPGEQLGQQIHIPLGDELEGLEEPPLNLEILPSDAITVELLTDESTYHSAGDESLNTEKSESEKEEIQDLHDRSNKCKEAEKDIITEEDSPIHELKSITSSRKSSKRRTEDFSIPAHIKQYEMSKLRKATKNFSRDNILGEGGYGKVYRGKLDGVQVAIKLLNSEGKQGRTEFQQEVSVLSVTNHSNIVRLIGVCLESCAIIYELMPNGTLKQRLAKGLSWQDRIRIIAELRSALTYLHTRQPHAIIHADLKFSNILMDEHDASYIGDFGTARMVPRKSPDDHETICWFTTPMGTAGYMDPMFVITGELTTLSDIYAFGVMILQMLTGLREMKIAEQVNEGIQMGILSHMLDTSAGNWPVVHTEQLVHLALRCCSLERKDRPSLQSSDWRTLEILQAMAGKSRMT